MNSNSGSRLVSGVWSSPNSGSFADCSLSVVDMINDLLGYSSHYNFDKYVGHAKQFMFDKRAIGWHPQENLNGT